MGMNLTVREAEFYYDATKTSGFKDVNFSLKDGEVLSILGPNGCGKTTLLKCLNRLTELHGGRILLDNQNIAHMPRNQIAKAIGYVPQVHQPAFPFTVLDTVLVGRAPHLGLLESPTAKDMELAEQALESMGIHHLKDKAYTQISGGERQMVIFARVLAQQPSLLLLDEPTSHLDFGNQIRLLHEIKKLAATGLPIIMTSHFPDHVFMVSSMVAIMKEGVFIDCGLPDDIVTEANMQRIYGIPVSIRYIDGPVKRKICIPVTE
jgi:iron complex transport system ATP-binding protein